LAVKVREKYQGLPRQELLDKAYELGVGYLENAGSCSQSTVAALHEILGFDDMVVKVATSQEGGTARQFMGACGAVAGGVIVLDYYFGRPVENMSYKESIQANRDKLEAASKPPMLLVDKFVKEYGTYTCIQMQRHLFGRIYCLTEPNEWEKFVEAGNVEKCDDVVGKAVRWVIEILLDEGAIEL
jgi:hypothetical protein